MDAFLSLPLARQNQIINTAMGIFAKLGYKKTSTSDIAAAIGLSKGMIFRYFGTKKDLYFYLINCAYDLMSKTFQRDLEPTDTDFFERITVMTQLKINVLHQHSAMLGFLNSAYFEADEEVAGGLKHLLSQGASLRDELVLTDVDVSKFKDTVDPQLLLQMLIKIGEGYANAAQDNRDWEAATREFFAFAAMLKRNFYKEEYL